MPAGRPHSPGVWLLDLQVGGHVYRFATEAVEVRDGRQILRYEEGLSEPGLSYGAAAGVGDARVQVTIASDVDWALLVEQGHALDRCQAVLRRWFEGRSIERCKVLLRGLTSSPTYGAQGEPLSVSIVRSLRGQTRTWPPPQAAVDESTWTVSDDADTSFEIPGKAHGAAYPLVVGAPGGTEDAEPYCVVPVPQAEFRAAAIGQNRVIWLGGHAHKVRFRKMASAAEDTTVESEDREVGTINDLLGRDVQYALTNGSDGEGEYRLGFRDDTAYGGGILYEGELLRGAGDVIAWVLRGHYDGPVDLGRVNAVRQYLNAWKIDTFINGPINLWDWLASQVLPLLPVEMREGPRGVYPALLRFDLTARDSVAHLHAGPGGRVERDGAVMMIDATANEVTIEYRPSGETGAQWLSRRVITARGGVLSGDDATDVLDSRVLASALCSESQRRYGIRPLRIQAASVWDTATAVLTAQHLVARRAWPRRAVRYVGGAWLEEIEVGQAVTLTDPDLHVEDAVALVADVTPSPSGASIDLVLLDHPVTKLRATT